MKKNLILSTLYQILTMITPLVTAPYVSRILGPDGVGVYSYTNSILVYFSMAAALGTASYGSREIARHRDCAVTYSKIFWEIELLTVFTSLLCLCIWMIWCFLNTTYRIYYLILSLFLLATMFDISWFYTGLEKFQYTILQNSIFKILGVIAIFLFVKQKEDLGIYITIMSLVTLLGNVSMWMYLPRFLQSVSFKSLHIKPHFKETLVYFIPAIATSIYTVLDKTLLGAITHNEFENGYYEQASKIIGISKSVTFIGVNSVLGSRMSWLFVQKAYDEIRERISQSMDYILFMGIGICFGILGVADRFIPLFFGPGYEKTILVLKLMCPLVLIVGISNCLGAQYYSPAGLRSLSTKFLITGSCVNLILNLILIPWLASIGAVIATLAAEGIITILYLRYSDGYIYPAELLHKSFKKLLAGVIMCVAVIWTGTQIDAVWGVFVQITCGVCIYVLILTVLKDSFIFDLMIPAIYKRQKRLQ